MPATVKIAETNGPSANPVVTDGILNINFGSADAPNLDPDAHAIVLSRYAPTYSVAKWLRLHLVDLGGSSSISNLKVWKSAGAYLSGEGIGSNVCNGHSAPSWSALTYAHGTGGMGAVATPYTGDGSAILGGNTWLGCPLQAVEPATNNLSIGGSITATLSAPGYSDYVILGLQVNGSLGTPAQQLNPKQITFQWDEQ
jgi:hypothetical protein